MANPEVLVGISTHNRADILAKAIASAFDQHYAPLRVGVVDDASSDATPSIASRFPQVDWTRWDENRGYVAARNKLMLETDARYYVSLDDDAWFLEGDEIALAVELLERNPEVAAVAFDIVSPDRPDTKPRSPAVRTAMFIGCGHVLRLDVVRKLNGYAKFPGGYGGEEKDLCLRLLDAGYEVLKLPGVHVWHDKSPTARDFYSQHRSAVCNDLTIAVRRAPMAFVPAAVAWKLFRHIAFALRAKSMDPCLAGIRAFFRTLPATWRDRGPVRLKTLQRFGELS
jgi:GT2 family glycosyltransferase